ncbi:lambda exonuclease family protein [Curtobacterium sp. MCBD17_030]|uniref:lambda exonuclease family protein n=1 Tax=Curtobacterium sp. MCBD17_030 TaxID=2175649 RepID=UPI0015E8917F|nr:lambda exonuclease family protein [Curtobacterium sp. MCBD17_030]
MTALTIHMDVEQGSDQWLQLRCGILTASTIGKLITPTLKVADNDTSRGVMQTLIAERISGHVEYSHPSFDMQRGTMDEPYARELYEQHHAPVNEIGFATLNVGGHLLGASPDGLVDVDGGIEIKSRAPKTQLRTFLDDRVPTENLAQIHACMFVLDREWWDYVSYAGGWPLYVKRVHRDEKWDDVIRAALQSYEQTAADTIRGYELIAAGRPVAERVDHWADEEIRI